MHFEPHVRETPVPTWQEATQIWQKCGMFITKSRNTECALIVKVTWKLNSELFLSIFNLLQKQTQPASVRRWHTISFCGAPYDDCAKVNFNQGSQHVLMWHIASAVGCVMLDQRLPPTRRVQRVQWNFNRERHLLLSIPFLHWSGNGQLRKISFSIQFCPTELHGKATSVVGRRLARLVC